MFSNIFRRASRYYHSSLNIREYINLKCRERTSFNSLNYATWAVWCGKPAPLSQTRLYPRVFPPLEKFSGIYFDISVDKLLCITVSGPATLNRKMLQRLTCLDFSSVVEIRLFAKSVLGNDVNNKLGPKLPCVWRLCFNPASFSIHTEFFAILSL